MGDTESADGRKMHLMHRCRREEAPSNTDIYDFKQE